MNTFNVPYSLKNIPVPSKLQYEKQLISKIEKVIQRMRWKLFFTYNPHPERKKENFGLKSDKSIPFFDEIILLKPFEDDVLELISNIKYQRKFNQFQQKLAQDCQQIKQSRDLIVKSDKTNNNYRMPVQDYKTMLKQNVTKSYKKTNTQEVFQTNREAAQLAKQLEIDDRIETLSELPAYVTIKDHKNTFPGRIECRLINPSKTKMGLIFGSSIF